MNFQTFLKTKRSATKLQDANILFKMVFKGLLSDDDKNAEHNAVKSGFYFAAVSIFVLISVTHVFKSTSPFEIKCIYVCTHFSSRYYRYRPRNKYALF